jgi:hypothetical protein
MNIIDDCPSCGSKTLFIDSGGWITCAEPGLTRAVQALKDEVASLEKRLDDWHNP